MRVPDGGADPVGEHRQRQHAGQEADRVADHVVAKADAERAGGDVDEREVADRQHPRRDHGEHAAPLQLPADALQARALRASAAESVPTSRPIPYVVVAADSAPDHAVGDRGAARETAAPSPPSSSVIGKNTSVPTR